MTNSENRQFDEQGLAIGWVPPFSNDKALLQARIDFFKNTDNKTIPYITSEYVDFIEKFEQSLSEHKSITVHGVELFKQKDVITGCQHFIDQLIMTYGLKNIQVFKGGYTYYQKLDPNFIHVDLESMMPEKPLILEYPFPSIGDQHPEFHKIISKANDIGVDVYLDCAWLPSSWDLELDLSEGCIKGMAMSLSKCFGLHWSRIGVRWLKEAVHDTIAIENEYRMVSYPNVMIGKYYLDRFPMDYLITKYKQGYLNLCTAHNLRPCKTIMGAHNKEKDSMVGVANLLLNHV